MKSTACVVAMILATSSIAAAEGDDESEGVQHSLTVSVSPVHLIFPMFEGEIEFKATPQIGIALIGGGGRITDRDKTISATAYEVGGQLNYYFLQPFKKLHVGAEALYLTADDIMQDSTLAAQGLSIGAYLGYKVQTDVGFAFIAQAGVAYLAATAESSTAMASESRISPLLNLNIGWSM